jgi:ubiquinone/menaquinone biosynthesis C-methylase UbiE
MSQSGDEVTKLSYCLIGDPHAIDGVKNSGDVVISGLWQWSLAFDEHGKKGDVRLLRRKEEIEEYDIVHINMTSGNLPLPQMIRDELGDNSNTKLVVNIDFDVMQWGANWQYPTLLTKAIDCADMIFHVESTGASILEHVLNRNVHTLPHPVDVVGLDCTLPYFAQKDIPLYRVLLGHTGKVPTHSMYDFVYEPRPFIDTIETMASATFGCDLYPGRSYGRSVVEFAALAVPCVCSNTIEASRRCFPALAIDPFDVAGAHKLFETLIDDTDKTVDIYKYAYEAAGYYSQKNSYERMVEVIEELPDTPEKQWQAIQTRYEKRTTEPKRQDYIDFAKEVAAKFKTFVGTPGLILDVGCGNGKYAGGTYESVGHEYLSDGDMIIGLDPLSSTEDRFPVVSAYGEHIPFQNNIFDGVVIVSVLDHLIDPIIVLKESKRVLKDDGKVFICSSIQEEVENPHHMHTWTKEGLLMMVEQVFKISNHVEVGSKPLDVHLFIEGGK